jgi:hypothetical protein
MAARNRVYALGVGVLVAVLVVLAVTRSAEITGTWYEPNALSLDQRALTCRYTGKFRLEAVRLKVVVAYVDDRDLYDALAREAREAEYRKDKKELRRLSLLVESMVHSMTREFTFDHWEPGEEKTLGAEVVPPAGWQGALSIQAEARATSGWRTVVPQAESLLP